MAQEGLRGIEFDVAGRLRRIGRERLIAELRRYGKVGRRPYTVAGFRASGARVSADTVMETFGSFRAGCAAAGLDTCGMRQRRYSDEDLLAAFEEMCRHRVSQGLAAVPSNWRRYRAAHGCGVDLATLTGRFGTFREFLAAYDRYHKGAISRGELLAQLAGRKKRPRPALPARLRAETLKRFDHRCTACGRGALDLEPRERLEVDHLRPVALGGGDEPANLTVRCTLCNRGKGARFVG